MIIYPFNTFYWHDGAMWDTPVWPMQQSVPERVQRQVHFVSLKKRDNERSEKA